MTVRCMRKTLHTLPLHLAAAAHAATLSFRDRDARRAIHNAGLSTDTVDRMIDQLCALLQDGPLPHRVIEARLSTRGEEVRCWRLAIKVAWERGTIAYINATSAWNREARTFALTSAAYPTLDRSLTREQAVTQLITAYFERYGPASLRDASWWSGLPATDIRAALLACGRSVTKIATPWGDDPCLMFADQVDESLSDQPIATDVRFLAHEDSALKAYFQTRSRYLGGLPQRRVFNQIGEVRPCVILDGLVVGTWSWNPRTATVDVDLVPGKATASVRRRINAGAASLSDILRSAWEPSPRSRHATGDPAPLAPPLPSVTPPSNRRPLASRSRPARAPDEVTIAWTR